MTKIILDKSHLIVEPHFVYYVENMDLIIQSHKREVIEGLPKKSIIFIMPKMIIGNIKFGDSELGYGEVKVTKILYYKVLFKEILKIHCNLNITEGIHKIINDTILKHREDKNIKDMIPGDKLSHIFNKVLLDEYGFSCNATDTTLPGEIKGETVLTGLDDCFTDQLIKVLKKANKNEE